MSQIWTVLQEHMSKMHYDIDKGIYIFDVTPKVEYL